MDDNVNVKRTFKKIWVPQLGMEISSENDAQEFYNRYAFRTGFCTRKEYGNISNRDERSVLTSRKFMCNKAGVRKKDKRNVRTKKQRPKTWMNCEAFMKVKLDKDGMYKFVGFYEEHSHKIYGHEIVHMGQSHRSVSEFDETQIDLCDESGITPTMAFEYLGNQAGGRDNVGYMLVDMHNYLRTKRQRSLEFGEVGSLLHFFQKQAKENSAFQYKVQLDIEQQITNIFWANAKMIQDYAQFGDVVSFDTTFRTNKMDRPFGVFIGLNHHRGITVFGAALLYDETIDSFRWLFQTFLDTHNEKNPLTIFTNQDSAMESAISYVLLDGRIHGMDFALGILCRML